MNNKYYVTTPIFYPTGTPHIGTAYNVFIADTLARYYRQKWGEENVFFLTGTDEHGANIAKKATEEGITPQEYVDRFAKIYQDVWSSLNISNNEFIRTTNKEHEKFIQELIQKSYDNGDLYEGEYSGWYCESCEAYYTEDDLVEGKCPNHPTKTPVFTTEKNYYFKLSKYQDWLLKYLEENKDFVRPQKWYDYVVGLVKAGLKDIPVTRANVKWGVPVPWNPDQTIYVWYDALPNYLSVLHQKEYAKQDYYNKFWQSAHHLVGKDILKFHAILWPAMLKSAGYPLPQQVIVHGFFTVDGQKIGKSNNNAIDPRELAQKYTIDGVRYALLSEFQLGNDGDFNFSRLEIKYNSDLANNFGNLLNRVIHLANKKGLKFIDLPIEDEFFKQVDKYVVDYHKHFENLEIFEAIQTTTELCTWANQYVNDTKPWEESADAAKILGNLYYLLKVAIIFFTPIIPESAEKAHKALFNQETIILFPKIENKK